MAGNKRKGTELAVLKGRKTDLTHAMFQILSKEALVKYDLHKKILDQGFKDTHYGTIKKKIKILEERGYLEQVGVRKTQPSSEASFIKQPYKALAALKLSITNLEKLFGLMDEETAMELLALLSQIQGDSF